MELFHQKAISALSVKSTINRQVKVALNCNTFAPLVIFAIISVLLNQYCGCLFR